ncbi:MAG: NAD+ synthase [Alphaproteobacteria bacterium]
MTRQNIGQNMANELRLTLAQLNPTVGDLDGNAKRIIDVWKKHKDDCDLVIFPELFLCGYSPEDLVLNHAFIKQTKHIIDHICKESNNYSAAALIPTIWQENENLYNAALLIEQGKITNVIKKHSLPNYGVFDEQRVFNAGPIPKPIDFRDNKIGIMICEDLWNDDIAVNLEKHGAKLLISLNASPYDNRKIEQRNLVSRSAVERTNLPLIYLHMFGAQDELVFDGQSFIMNSEQEKIYTSPAYKDDVFQAKLLKSGNIETQRKPYPSPSEQSLIYDSLKTGIKDYVYKNGFKRALIGLSGGIDSALTAALAVDALGNENVRCIMLPSEFTSQESLDDAKECAKMLGVEYDIIPIKDAVKIFERIIPNLNGLAHENTQSRIRGTILMAMSNASGEMLITTGNKSEMAVGYCTLYGDMNGGYNALKDIYKTDVYALSSWRNSQKNKIMPQRIITKSPTAELRENQTDQDSLPPYDLLDDILKLLIEYDDIDWGNAPTDLIKMRDKCLEHPETVSKIARLLKNSEFKRFQSAPGTRITFRAFGRDRRYPMTNHFINNIEKNT